MSRCKCAATGEWCHCRGGSEWEGGECHNGHYKESSRWTKCVPGEKLEGIIDDTCRFYGLSWYKKHEGSDWIKP